MAKLANRRKPVTRLAAPLSLACHSDDGSLIGMLPRQNQQLAVGRRNPPASARRRGSDLRATGYFGLGGLLGGGIVTSAPFFTYGVIAGRADFIYLSAAILILVLPLIVSVLQHHRFDLFEPINIVAGTIFFGTTLRALYLIFLPERTQAQFLMMGQSFQEINQRIIWIVIGVGLFCVGYGVSFARRRTTRASAISKLVISRPRLHSVLLVTLALSLFGVLLYAGLFGINLGGNLLAQSSKRSATYLNSAGEEIYATAWQGILAQLGLYGGFVLASAMIAGIVRARAYWLALAAALFICGSIVPFIGQSRTPIILTVFSVVVFTYYYEKIKLRHAVFGVVAVAIFTAGMGELRAINANRVAHAGNFIDATVGSGNGFDAVRSTAIIGRMPEKAGYLYGSSYLEIPLFWVPRAVWPDKPPTSLGAWVKAKLFDVRLVVLGGWPPGFVAESYMNFGYIGIFTIPFLIGLGMRAVYDNIRPLLGKSYMATAIYATFLYKLAFDAASLNLAQGITTGLLIAIPVALMIRLSSRKLARRTVPANHARPVLRRTGPPQPTT